MFAFTCTYITICCAYVTLCCAGHIAYTQLKSLAAAFMKRYLGSSVASLVSVALGERKKMPLGKFITRVAVRHCLLTVGDDKKIANIRRRSLKEASFLSWSYSYSYVSSFCQRFRRIENRYLLLYATLLHRSSHKCIKVLIAYMYKSTYHIHV